MKHWIAITLVAFLFNNCLAQSDIFVGGQASFNSLLWFNQNSYGENELAYKFKPGVGLGLQAGYQFAAKSAIAIELNFVQQGASYDETINTINIVREVEQSYLQIPIMYHWRSNRDLSGFFFDIGLSLGFLTGASISQDPVIYNPPSELNSQDITERLVSFEPGFLIGLGYKYDLNENIDLKFGFKSYTSITDINASAWQQPNLDGIYEPSRNGRGGIEVSLLYYLGGKTRWVKQEVEDLLPEALPKENEPE